MTAHQAGNPVIPLAAHGGAENTNAQEKIAERREAYPFSTQIVLRWSDFDMMGHVNNVQYMRFFECVVVEFFRTHDSYNFV